MTSKTSTDASDSDSIVEKWIPRFPIPLLTKTERWQSILYLRLETNALITKICAGLRQYDDAFLPNSVNLPSLEIDLQDDTINPGGQVEATWKYTTLHPINIHQIKVNKQYSGYKLELEIIDEPAFLPDAKLKVIGMDNLGHLVLVSIRSVDLESWLMSERLRSVFEFGTRITIANPLITQDCNGRKIINCMDNAALLIHKFKDYSSCRFCLNRNASQRCSRCGVFYCGPDCQQFDWTLLKHRYVCDYKLMIKPVADKLNELARSRVNARNLLKSPY